MPGARAAPALPAEVRCQQRVQNTRPSRECDAVASAFLPLLFVALCKADAGFPRPAAWSRQSPGMAAAWCPWLRRESHAGSCCAAGMGLRFGGHGAVGDRAQARHACAPVPAGKLLSLSPRFLQTSWWD